MKNNSHIWFAMVAITIALSASNTYLFLGLRTLKSQVASNYVLSEHDVVELVDKRLDSLEKRRSREMLNELETKYQLAPPSTPDGRLIYGSTTARITLQEFADIECPFCRKMHADIKQVVDLSNGVINWEFKHFPLSRHNPAAAKESQAIECIAETYGNRTAWVALDRFIAETKGGGRGVGDFGSFVRGFGLNGRIVENCLASDSHKVKINGDYQDGKENGISSTPSLKLIDNSTGRSLIVSKYKSSEEILQFVQQLLTP